MKLSKVILHNYRCYKNDVLISIDNLTCIIGRNDVGKSSIMEALDAFFNDNNINKSDLTAAAPADDQKIEITCVFTNLPEEMVLDTSAPCNLDEEGLLNAQKELEIKRVWDCSGKTLGKTTYLHCNYYNAPEADGLLSKKKDTLKTLIQNSAIAMLEGGKTTINRDMRRAIRAHYNMVDRSEQYIKVDGGLTAEDNIKSIWKVISDQLPIYALFKMDRILSDKDGNVQDPMKLAIEEALKVEEIQQKLRDVEEFVKTHTSEIADATIQKLANFDSKLAERLQASFSKECKWSSVFDISLLNENNIPLNKRGSGIRRLVLLSFFQAQAETKKLEKNAPSIIYAIEEPETSQHPEHQLEIIHSLITLAEQPSTQVVFTTHSANLVCEIPIESIRYVVSEPNLEVKIPLLPDGNRDEQILSEIIERLGILPSPTDKVKVLLYVEGNNDISALKGYSKILFDADVIQEDIMASEKVGIVITGGSSLRYYIDNKYLDGLGKPAIHIYDNDKEEYRNYVASINAAGNPNKKAFNTSMLEMENFLCKEAIEEAYSDNGTVIALTPIAADTDVPVTVCKAMNPDWDTFDEEKKGQKESKVKRMLNGQAVKKMTIDRLATRGVKDELKGWFDTIIALGR
ncbi:MAG: ATP-binding protein [Prevotella sp.]|nr:ATP-binding protein [Prevotella sp.]